MPGSVSVPRATRRTLRALARELLKDLREKNEAPAVDVSDYIPSVDRDNINEGG